MRLYLCELIYSSEMNGKKWIEDQCKNPLEHD